ncbi:hypothetical protein V7266_05515, partial [Neobacillus drentensis]|uniref:hypothetical protein n=1 Tax=Neobacillus drentensis TaxID=220684 RepID=UPI002FFE5D60
CKIYHNILKIKTIIFLRNRFQTFNKEVELRNKGDEIYHASNAIEAYPLKLFMEKNPNNNPNFFSIFKQNVNEFKGQC